MPAALNAWLRSVARTTGAVVLVISTLPAAPPAARMYHTTAGLLALGSSPSATFPVSQWYPGHRLADYSCGGSRGLRPKAGPRSLLIPVRGTVARLIRLAA